jgi:hypothetical protein
MQDYTSLCGEPSSCGTCWFGDEMVAMKAQELSLRAIAAEMRAKGFQISHEGVRPRGARG